MEQKKHDLLDIIHLIYVMDPMCSWCYGFAPVIKQLVEEQEGNLQFKLVMGGLRPGTEKPLEEQMKESIKTHWQDVEKITEQPFDYTFFERDDFVYDTEPGCRAVVSMRYLKPEYEFDMARAVQSAFYAKNTDVTKPAVLASIASSFGVEEDAFLEKYASEEMKEKTQQDFTIARHLQATAFPSLYLLNGTSIHLISRGYRPYDGMKAHLERVLKQLNTDQNPLNE
ncbi:DsbA family protein [Pontibacter anaerobius]|uniref:DsbA family protein n=1 Tax=Pontibacter anaerobius TaxID=2993940 RepID=A0ABT3RBN7_9BACT|nr:DsbA family protein [Pontibacter anaerobius]MCX2739274.1 DsbA family protein [Pontibacter anaerobius]